MAMVGMHWRYILVDEGARSVHAGGGDPARKKKKKSCENPNQERPDNPFLFFFLPEIRLGVHSMA